MSRAPRVLLIWPGSEGSVGGNFGMPQLVSLATYAQRETGATLHLRDLGAEAALGASFAQLLAGPEGQGYDVIGFSVYSSYDHLKGEALAGIARELYPEACLVAGGYHPSARPGDYVYPGSPFDVAVVGEGERALVEVIEAAAGGEPLRQTVLGPLPLQRLDDLPRSDWSLLERYRELAPRIATQAQVYLSRGCPYDCAFCMERVKVETSWRPRPVEDALEEVRALHGYFGLDRGWTLYVGDALFGMKTSWRREFLDRLAALDLPLKRIWFLIRVDTVEDEDLRLFAAANCSPGFGLETGDRRMLGVIRKKGRLDDYHERMLSIAARARELNVPWGANVICGHPGETPASLRSSAAFLRRLFLDPKGTSGFLSVDPFRLYPGSPIDAERSHYEQTYGTRFYRTEWWQDGDQEFLSEWVDPSAELDYLTREQLQHEELGPLLGAIEDNFVFEGRARDYYLRAIREQVSFSSARHRAHYFARHYAWQRYLGHSERGRRLRRAHPGLAELQRAWRAARLPAVARAAGLEEEPSTRQRALLELIERVPRERFVPLDRLDEAAGDRAVSLGPDTESPGEVRATLSAMHAYLRSFDLLEVEPGDEVLDLGGGSGYGAALLAERVGAAGRVVSLELDPALSRWARAELAALGLSWAEARPADALDPSTWPCAPGELRKVTVGFALEEVPASWDAFAEGTRVVAPLARGGAQRLTLLERTARGWRREAHEEVRYVAARRPEDLVASSAPRALPLA